MQLGLEVLFAVLVPVVAVGVIAYWVNKSAAANAGPNQAANAVSKRMDKRA